ncbi:MAG TPA: polymer-forming cytoskeletal protein [Candidatus Dormibacteraeota bacterium]|nr:polymer-forming cytoskeletal protein [Candidatus Dormibacteraeota bacterium]
MATEPSASKLRVETNGNGTAIKEEAVEPVQAEGLALPVVSSSAAPVIQATQAPVPEVELSVLSRGDSASGRWIIGGDGQVQGEFRGEIECAGSLLVGRGAEVTASIRGNEVTIAGLVRGNVTVLGRLRITSTGRLEGDARVGALVVQEGGVHHGVIRVHPEGVPEIDVPVAEGPPANEPLAVPQTPVDRVKKFWGEFF